MLEPTVYSRDEARRRLLDLAEQLEALNLRAQALRRYLESSPDHAFSDRAFDTDAEESTVEWQWVGLLDEIAGGWGDQARQIRDEASQTEDVDG